LRILYLTQYFPPETGATQNRALAMARHLADQGHQVTVVCEFPNHPHGILPERYRGRLFEREDMAGLRVLRGWVYATPRKTFGRRLVFYISFMISSFLVGLLAGWRFDAVYATSPPFFVGFSGWLLARLKGARFVFEVRDLWPDSAIALGILRNRTLIRLSKRLEHFYYRRAARIVVVTRGIRQQLLREGVAEKKLVLIPNGSSPEHFRPMPADDLRRRLGLEGKFVVGYAGVFGLAQGMEHLCDLAAAMRGDTGIHFLFVGEGPKRQQVLQLQKKLGLDNLTVHPGVTREEMPEMMSVFDTCLVPLRQNELFEGALPSKMFDAMACERPVILSVAGEAKAVLESADAGLAVEPEDIAAMRAAVLRLRDDPAARRRMGANGRRLVESEYSRPKLASQLEQALVRMKEKTN
jgi:glycosyltransferase involved in cell wall biosynthesis